MERRCHRPSLEGTLTRCSSTKEEKAEYAGRIPGITKTLKWANQRYEEAVNRQSHKDSPSPPPTYNGQGPNRRHPGKRGSYIENEAEEWKAFIEYNEAKIIEEDDKRRREELRLWKLEEERKEKEERIQREEIAAKAIADYKEEKEKEAVEREKRRLEALEDMRRRLENAQIPEEQIQAVLDGVKPGQALVPFHPKPSMIDDNAASDITADRAPKQKQRGARRSMLIGLARMLARAGETSRGPRSATSSDFYNRHVDPDVLGGPYILEAWSIDQFLQHRFRIPISDTWLAKYLDEQEKNGHERKMWGRYSRLHPWYKKEISELFEEKLTDKNHVWSMVSLEKVRQRSRSGFMGHAGEQVCLQLILKRSKYDGEPRYRTNLGDSADGERSRSSSSASSSYSSYYSSPPSVASRRSRRRNKSQEKSPADAKSMQQPPTRGKTDGPPPASRPARESGSALPEIQKAREVGDHLSSPRKSDLKGSGVVDGTGRDLRAPVPNDTHEIVAPHGPRGWGQTIISKHVVDARALQKLGYEYQEKVWK